jgi:glyoxylase-like metal-dependent hydrolase (beta-lactamase superfamily II)
MAAVRELQRGLWWWEAVHPEWTAEDDAAGRDWGPEVSSYAIDDGTRLLLIDPTTPPEPVVEAAVEREVIIVLTNPWHERDAPSLAERFGAQVYAPPPDDGGRGIRMPAQLFSAGDRLPFGVDVFPGREPPYDVLLWVESHGAVAIGDTLIDRGDGIELLDSWLPDEVTRVQVVDGLRPLLALPIEHVLPTHGPPTDRAALERALA